MGEPCPKPLALGPAPKWEFSRFRKWMDGQFICFPPCVPPDCAREALADLDVSEVLILQLRRAPDAERRHVILEILGSLGESGRFFHNVWPL